MRVLRQPLRIILEGIRVPSFAAREFIHRAMQLVGSALERHVDDAAARVPVLRVVGIRLDLELLDRIDRRHICDVIAACLRVIRRAVEQEFVGRCAPAVDAPVGDRAIVERPFPDNLAIEVHAADEFGEHERVASVERQLVHALAVDDPSPVGFGCLQKRRFGADRHLFADGADLERQIERDGLSNAEDQIVAKKLLEPGRLNRYAVLARAADMALYIGPSGRSARS